MDSRCRDRSFARLASLAIVLSVLFMAACGDDRSPAPVPTQPPTQPAPKVEPKPTASNRPRIVCFGDSLTAGPGLPRGADYPSQLQRQVDEAGYVYEVVNAGVSGETSAGGLRRIDHVLDGGAAVVVLELGANDGLRGLPIGAMKQNLETMIQKSRAAGAKVLLAGMESPPNFGPEYTSTYRETFRELASKEKVVLIPFFLDGVAGRPELNLEDGIHPNPDGARIVANTVWTHIEPLLTK
jgi:acyl-CoA thioesterase I